jgi:hypothetical protein
MLPLKGKRVYYKVMIMCSTFTDEPRFFGVHNHTVKRIGKTLTITDTKHPHIKDIYKYFLNDGEYYDDGDYFIYENEEVYAKNTTIHPMSVLNACKWWNDDACTPPIGGTLSDIFIEINGEYYVPCMTGGRYKKKHNVRGFTSYRRPTVLTF